MSWAHRKLVPASCAGLDFREIEADLLAGALVLSWHGRACLSAPSAREGVGQGQPVRLSNAAPRSYERKTMTTYIALFNLTEAGIKAAKDSPRRLDAAKKLLADMGGEMKQFYMVMGEFDFVGICEAPDDAVMARYVLQLGGLGFVRTKTLKAFPETAYREIIRSLG